MYSTIRRLAAAGLLVASTAQAQTPERALLSHTLPGYGIAGTFSATGPARVHPALVLDVAGERALLGRVESLARPMDPVRFTDAPIDGARALLGKWPPATAVSAGGTARRSSFRAEVRGDVTTTASGEAEFGAIKGADSPSSGFTVSLGVRGDQSAVLFTRMSGASLGVGRYRNSDRGNGADEILALVMTGPATSPTGVFRGRSGWVDVTAVSDRLLTGRFQVDGVGFLAAEPQREDRPVRVTGSFSATAAAS
ncbi:MAG: hypothetical protein ACREMX_17015 [Gemmatimonadales bacterium]